MDEFALIHQHFAGLSTAMQGVVLGIGDDAALLSLPQGQQLVVTTDTLVAGRHFPLDTAPYDIGWKSLAVNLSDLAAMGAAPLWFTLALTLPVVESPWLADFAAGLKALADAHGVALVGGDTTRGPLSITITAMGAVAAGKALLRSGAQVGDSVGVTGTLGDAALGLALHLGGQAPTQPSPATRGRVGVGASPSSDLQHLKTRLNRPIPQLQAAKILAQHATAAIDISDGLAADLNHILNVSGVGAMLIAEQLPRSPAFSALAPADQALGLQLHGGDDYELCVCLPPEHFAAQQAALAQQGIAFTQIGVITAEPGLRLCENGSIRLLEPRGYNHFATP